MKIIAHRGYWKESSEKNTLVAFRRAFELGFGVETDIRDFGGKLVISHDIPSGNEMLFADFLTIYQDIGSDSLLALNIKSDGLQELIKQQLLQCQIKNYFVFDMSIPDTLSYINLGLNFFVRQSEFEIPPLPFVDRAAGIWFDGFNEDVFDAQYVEKCLKAGHQFCIVSPELHCREHLPSWKKYKKSAQLCHHDNLMICTDHPEQAKEFFCDQN